MLLSRRAFRILLFLLVLLSTPLTLRAAEDAVDSVTDILVQPTDELLDLALGMQHTEMDCSHLVHYLYRRSGLEYDYANSITLYKGVNAFRPVAQPQAGDLIVWRGHAGIVVDPEQHTFISALRTGVKISSYVSRYWRNRGMPRFLRYVGTGSAESHR